MAKRRRWRRWVDAEQASKLLGIIAAMTVVVLVNVLAERRFTRWDWTTDRLYTLSAATIQTLHDLPDTIEVWVLLGPADPIEQSVKQLLVAYRAETSRLDVHYIDPERDVLALEDVKKRFRIETGRTEEGHVAADAVVVVARGDKHWFITSSEMVEIAAEGARVKPREERALTGAIRNVLGGSKTTICFTTGHGEASPVDPSEHGAGVLKDVLDKDNFNVKVVDLAGPDKPKPLDGCGVAIVAGLRGAFAGEEAERLRTWLLAEGNLFVAAGPIFGVDPTAGLIPAGLERVLAPFGIALEDDVVAEQDPALMFPEEGGLRFVAQPRPHPITTALVKTRDALDVPRIIVHRTRSLRRIEQPGAAAAQALLSTSAQAFGLRNIEGAARWKEAPQRRAGDVDGPLTLALAAERPKGSPSAAHGPRVVVVGSESVVVSLTFREPLPYRGAALFTSSAISWLASKPQVLDVPEKAPVGSGIKLDEDARSSLRRYVILFMPSTVALLGVAIALFRRSSEGSRRRRRPARPDE